MTTTATAPRTNVGSRHPELYGTITTMAALADQAALAEGLSPRLIELVKIRVSQINGCAYCLRIHTADSLSKGESQDRAQRPAGLAGDAVLRRAGTLRPGPGRIPHPDSGLPRQPAPVRSRRRAPDPGPDVSHHLGGNVHQHLQPHRHQQLL
jgi:AhpD family alkylhydroperoxidase